MLDLMVNLFVKSKISGWLSCRPFLLSHLLAKVSSLPLNSSILKDKTRVFRWRDLTGPDKLPTPPRQGSSSPPFGKNDSQMPECWRGGGEGGGCWSLDLIDAFSWDRHCLILWFSLSSRCVLVSNDSLWKNASWPHYRKTLGSHWGTIRLDWSDDSLCTTKLPWSVGSSGGCYLDHCLDHS